MSIFNELANGFIRQREIEDEDRKRDLLNQDLLAAASAKRESALVGQAIGNLRAGDVQGAASLIPSIAQQRRDITGVDLAGPKLPEPDAAGTRTFSPAQRSALEMWLSPLPPQQQVIDGWAVGMDPQGRVVRQRALPEKPQQLITTDANGNTVVSYLPEATVGQTFTIGGGTPAPGAAPQGMQQSAGPQPSGSLSAPTNFRTNEQEVGVGIFGRAIPVTSGFGQRTAPTAGASTNHQAYDFGVPDRTPFKADVPARVTFAGRKSGYGLTLEMQDAYGYTHRFAHLSTINVKPGQIVQPGQGLGLTGGVRGRADSGTSTGPHLHYQVLAGQRSVNPLDYFRAVRGRQPRGQAQQGTQPMQGGAPITRARLGGVNIVEPPTQPYQGANNYFFVDPNTGAVIQTGIETPNSQRLQTQLEAARIRANAALQASQLRAANADQRSATSAYNKVVTQLTTWQKHLYDLEGVNDQIAGLSYRTDPAVRARVDATVSRRLAAYAKPLIDAAIQRGEIDQSLAQSIYQSYGIQSQGAPSPFNATGSASTGRTGQSALPAPASPALDWSAPASVPSTVPVAPTLNPQPQHTPMARPAQASATSSPSLAPARQKLDDVLATPSPLLRPSPQVRTPQAPPSAAPTQTGDRPVPTLRELQQSGQGNQRRRVPQAKELSLRDYQRMGRGNQQPRR